MHQPAETDESPRSPGPASSTLTMEAREGRIGNAFACERCRKHKVRCVPSDTTGICQRCQKARVECVEHIARRRPAKARNEGQPPHRMRDFDKKLDKLSAIVATMAPNPTPQPSLPSVSTLPSQINANSQVKSPPPPAPPASAPPVSKTPILPAPGSGSENSLAFWESINDTLSCLGRLDPAIRSISLVHMQMMLDTYQHMADFFPFVPLPKDSFCRDLVLHRPILMFAVLTVGSYESKLLQLTLSREFRKVIMVKIMNGEKSLDLLQGLLVFIAWHHHYMDTRAVSVPMLLQICVGIARDLGLDNMSTAVRSPPSKEDSRDREAKRTYLGCYYLASNIGLMEAGKTRCVSYSSTLRAYASELAAAWEHKADATIPILIDVCQFTEDVEETFHDRSEQALVVRSQVKRLSDKLDHIRSASTMQAKDYKTLQWIQLAARFHLYKTVASLDFEDRDTPWASGFQLSLRVTYLRSIEDFLDNGTKLSSNQYELISLVDWMNLVSCITNLSKLVLHSSPLPGWDVNELQIAKSFDYFRDHLSLQMPRPRDNIQDNNEDVFERFRRITAVIKTTLQSYPGRGSPNSGTFEISTGSGRTVSLLQDLPLPKLNGVSKGPERLPSLWKVNPAFDMNNNEFHWKFLMGTV